MKISSAISLCVLLLAIHSACAPLPPPTPLPTFMPQPTATHSSTATPTSPATVTATATATATSTNTPTSLPTATATRTETPTPTATATITLTPTPDVKPLDVNNLPPLFSANFHGIFSLGSIPDTWQYEQMMASPDLKPNEKIYAFWFDPRFVKIMHNRDKKAFEFDGIAVLYNARTKFVVSCGWAKKYGVDPDFAMGVIGFNKYVVIIGVRDDGTLSSFASQSGGSPDPCK